MEDIIGTVGTTAVSAFASAGTGGLLGLLGSVVGGFFRVKQAAADRELRRLEFAQELEMQKLQIEVGKAETEQELMIAQQSGSWNNLETSMRAEMSLKGASGWVQDIKALFRPFLTLLLVVITAGLLYVLLTGNVSAEALYLDRETVANLVSYTVSSTVFTTSTAVAWWFGDRSMQPPGRK